jgi:hypothetical protein
MDRSDRQLGSFEEMAVDFHPYFGWHGEKRARHMEWKRCRHDGNVSQKMIRLIQKNIVPSM